MPSQKIKRFPVDRRLLVAKRINIIGIPLDISGYCRFYVFFWVLGSLRTSIVCIMGEFTGGGLAAVAVGVSDR